jgi:hypothetical protein
MPQSCRYTVPAISEADKPSTQSGFSIIWAAINVAAAALAASLSRYIMIPMSFSPFGWSLTHQPESHVL